MKTIKYINTFAIGLPFLIIILAYPFLEQRALLFGLLSTMATGFIQFCIGVKMLFDNPRSKSLLGYILGVALFFFLWLLNENMSYNDMSYYLFPIPLLLAIYLSIIIYKK
jgi:apolipoprotein N-acyltransferase